MIHKEEITPSYTMANVEQLTPEYVKSLGVEALGFDVDGTLSDYHSANLEPGVVATLHNLAHAGFALCIISNAYGTRVEQLRSHTFKGIIHPDAIITPGRVAPTGEDVSRYRKPNPAMILHAADMAGVDAGGLLVVGDQLLKDVVAANRAGSKSVLVPRRGKSDHLGVKLVQRPLEAVARAAYAIKFPDVS